MKVFFSHAHEDKDVVETIGSWLTKKGLDVWIDTWRSTPGDSLIAKIGEGIEVSDRLVVFLSPASVESSWVQKEVANGLVMELAEEKGLGDKFVIPALLARCKVPIFLRDKLYADFTNKAFNAACEELYRGLIGQPLGPQDKYLENRIIRTWQVKPLGLGKYAIVVEFGVRISPTEGLYVEIDVGAKYTDVREWFGPPNTPIVNTGNLFKHSTKLREPPIYARKFSSPKIISTISYYLYFEAEEQLEVKPLQFLDYYNREP